MLRVCVCAWDQDIPKVHWQNYEILSCVHTSDNSNNTHYDFISLWDIGIRYYLKSYCSFQCPLLESLWWSPPDTIRVGYCFKSRLLGLGREICILKARSAKGNQVWTPVCPFTLYERLWVSWDTGRGLRVWQGLAGCRRRRHCERRQLTEAYGKH